jgi:hypothetical protein
MRVAGRAGASGHATEDIALLGDQDRGVKAILADSPLQGRGDLPSTLRDLEARIKQGLLRKPTSAAPQWIWAISTGRMCANRPVSAE